MSKVKFYREEQIPLEMHKVRVVQKLTLLPVEERLKRIQEAGNNTFLLQNKDVYMDMLTDSGVNAMSDNQVASMGMAPKCDFASPNVPTGDICSECGSFILAGLRGRKYCKRSLRFLT